MAKFPTNLDFSTTSLFFFEIWYGGGKLLKKFSPDSFFFKFKEAKEISLGEVSLLSLSFAKLFKSALVILMLFGVIFPVFMK